MFLLSCRHMHTTVFFYSDVGRYTDVCEIYNRLMRHYGPRHFIHANFASLVFRDDCTGRNCFGGENNQAIMVGAPSRVGPVGPSILVPVRLFRD